MVQTDNGAYVYPNPDGNGRITFQSLVEPSALVLEEVDKFFEMAKKFEAWITAYISDDAEVKILDFACADESTLGEAIRHVTNSYTHVDRSRFRIKPPEEPYSCFDLDDLNQENDHTIANVIFNTMCLGEKDETYDPSSIVFRILEQHAEWYKPKGNPILAEEFPYGPIRNKSELTYHLCFHGTPVNGKIHDDPRLWYCQSAMVHRWIYEQILTNFLTIPIGLELIAINSSLRDQNIPGGLIVGEDFFRHADQRALTSETRFRVSLAEKLHGKPLPPQQLEDIATSVKFEGDVVRNMAWELISHVVTEIAEDMSSMQQLSQMIDMLRSLEQPAIHFPTTRWNCLLYQREMYRNGEFAVDQSWVQYDYLQDPDVVTRVLV